MAEPSAWSRVGAVLATAVTEGYAHRKLLLSQMASITFGAAGWLKSRATRCEDNTRLSSVLADKSMDGLSSRPSRSTAVSPPASRDRKTRASTSPQTQHSPPDEDLRKQVAAAVEALNTVNNREHDLKHSL